MFDTRASLIAVDAVCDVGNVKKLFIAAFTRVSVLIIHHRARASTFLLLLETKATTTTAGCKTHLV